MRQKHKFRPGSLDALEERVALSHAGAAEVGSVMSEARGQLVVNSHGRFATTLPSAPGAAYNLNLSGATRVPGTGVFRETGNLSSNPSLPPANSNTQGTIVLTSHGKDKGSITLSISGPGANLAPKFPQTDQFTFTVIAVTGQFSAAAGFKGTFDMTLATKGRAHHGVAKGLYTSTFSLG